MDSQLKSASLSNTCIHFHVYNLYGDPKTLSASAILLPGQRLFTPILCLDILLEENAYIILYLGLSNGRSEREVPPPLRVQTFSQAMKMELTYLFIYLFIYLRTRHSTSNIKSKIQ